MSTQGKATPGKWRIADVNDYWPGIEADCDDGTSISVVIYGEEEEECGVRGRTRKEAQANARLIAAAPALLEACRAIVQRFDIAAERFAVREGELAMADGLPYSETAILPEPPYVAQARVAIAQVEGQA